MLEDAAFFRPRDWTVVILLAVGLAIRAPAQSAMPKALSDLALGEHWFGRPVDQRALAGKVVLVVSWGPGAAAERCAGQMVRIVQGLKGRDREGVHLVFNVVNSKLEKETARDVLARIGPLPEQVSVVYKAGDGSVWLQGYPNYALYDHNGALAATRVGHVTEDYDQKAVAPQLKKLLDARPWIDLGPEPFRKLDGLVERILRKTDLATAYSEVDRLRAHEDVETRKEAQRLWLAISRQAQADFGIVRRIRAELPGAAVRALEAAAQPYAKTSLAEWFAGNVTAWQKDPDLRRAIVAEKKLERILKRLVKLPTCSRCRKGGIALVCDKCWKKRKPILDRAERDAAKAANGHEKLMVYQVIRSRLLAERAFRR